MAHLFHGLAGANNGSLPHAVAHHGHRDTDEAGSSLHATVAPRPPEIRRPPRNLRAEAKPAAPTPPPPRPRGRCPGLPAPASTSSEQAPDRALPGPDPAPAHQRSTSPPPMPHVAAPATSPR
nr:alpha carbonic anhydrase 8-like [Lolium perenne]